MIKYWYTIFSVPFIVQLVLQFIKNLHIVFGNERIVIKVPIITMNWITVINRSQRWNSFDCLMMTVLPATKLFRIDASVPKLESLTSTLSEKLTLLNCLFIFLNLLALILISRSRFILICTLYNFNQ